MSSSIAQRAPLEHPAGMQGRSPAGRASFVVLLSRLKQRLTAYGTERTEQRDKAALLRRARRYASTSPSYAADLFAAAGRDGIEDASWTIDPIVR